MKNFVDLKNYLIREIKPQENYQYFIFKELINSDGQISYDELANRYDAEYGNAYKTDTKTIFRDAPTKVLTKHGYITSDKNNVYANYKEEPLYYKETISWILEKCLNHWTINKSIKGLEFKEGIIKTNKEIEKFCSENNTPRDLVENIILSINRGEKQIILDGPPGTGKTYLIKNIIQFLGNADSVFDLVQFHPSYGYEEFVEGLRPTTEEGGLKFQVVPGILREMIENSESSFPINVTNTAATNYPTEDILEGFSAPEVLTSLSINELPKSPGVHLIYYEDTLLYVGETGNTRRRITEHMRSHHASGDTFINHSQKKFGLDLAKDEDKSKFDQLRSNMTIIYKLTEEKEALKNKLIDELKPEFNQKLASVNLSELNEDAKNSEHILLRFNAEWRDPASGTVMGVREYHQDVIDKNNYVWWGKYYVSRRIINSNKVQIYKEQLKNGVSTYVYFLENRPGVKMYKSKLLDITEDFSEVEKQLIPKYYRDVAEDDCEVYFKIDNFEEVDRTQTIDSLRKASDPTKVDGVKIALTGSSSYLSVILPYNEVTAEESSGKDSKTQDIEHKQFFEHFGSHDFLLIDEINRGNLPKIFGELLNAFEYRDENIGLQYSEKPLSVPSNLIFLGSMNSTDKSVGRIDAALRRRFDFIHVPPNYDVLNNYYQIMQNRVPNLISGLKKLNDELEKKLGKNCLVGHTFFMKKNSEPFTYDDLGKIWDRKIYPLLVEYFLDEPSELEIFNSFHNFWPVELEKSFITNKKKYTLEILSNDLEKINPKLKNEFNKIINWSKKYKEFDIYLGEREDPSFTTGGVMFIYKKNSETEGNKKRENYYHLFRITGKGKFEFRLKELYESKYTRAPFNKKNFRYEFEEKFKILFQTHNIEIKDNFFNNPQPGISFEDLVVNNGVDQMLNVWEWVIENINKASPND